MAERRMFAKTIVLSDAFLDMPLGARCLYMTMGMVADDDGFVNSPKSIIRQTGATEDDFKMLIAKKFILPFESGVIVIKHWRINNYLRSDRYIHTKYTDELRQLEIEPNGAYHSRTSEVGIPSIGIPSKEKDRLGKDSIGQVSVDKDRLGEENYHLNERIEGDCKGGEQSVSPTRPPKHKYGEYGHVLLTDEERDRLISDHGEADFSAAVKELDEYIEMKGYKAKSHYLAMTRWVFDAVKENRAKQKPAAGRLDWIDEVT